MGLEMTMRRTVVDIHSSYTVFLSLHTKLSDSKNSAVFTFWDAVYY